MVTTRGGHFFQLRAADRLAMISASPQMAVRPLTKHAKYLWLSIPFAGIVELLASLYFSKRSPRVEEWHAIERDVVALKRTKDLLVVAPDWAEPLARNALGDSVMPIEDVARPDETGYERAIEVAALGAVNPLVADWPLIAEKSVGKFVIRTRKNPAFRPATFVLTDHAEPPNLSVTERRGERETACAYSTGGRTSGGGGLLGRPTFPRQRFSCGRSEANFVGTTIIDDQTFRARRCLWANPAAGELLILKFAKVPVRDQLYGYVGLPYFTFRDHGWPAVSISFSIGDVNLGVHSHLPESGWQPFELSTTQFSGQTADIRIEIFGSESRELELCFYAATR